jgi:nucleotide-binding universal stress UspA family protein
MNPSRPEGLAKHVLVTTDLSPAAEPALHAAADLARRTDARVTVLNGIDFGALGESEALRESLLRVERDFRNEARPPLQELCERVFKGISMEIVFVEGLGGASSICTYAAENAVDLIVIATHGRSGIKRVLLGSVTERVVQHAPCDVIVVRSDAEAREDALGKLQKILVPTDFSKPADRALGQAVQVARLTQAEIHLLHAYEFPTTIGALDVSLAIPQEFYDQIRDAAMKQLDQRVKEVIAAGLEAEGHLIVGAPAPGILDAAARAGADLIVMGTRGRTGMKRVLVGSVAERTVRLASCPVMTVKAPD